MRIALGILLVGLWALVAAALLGPQASLSAVTALWLAGLLVALACWGAGVWWLAYWEAEERAVALEDEDAPYVSHTDFYLGLLLLAVLIPAVVVWDTIRAPGLRLRQFWREWRSRKAPCTGEHLPERVKALRLE